MTVLKKFGMIFGAGAVALTAAGVMTPALSAEVTLTAAGCFPIGSPVSKPFEAVVNALNEAGKGVVKIDLKGGAPAIGSPFTLTQKMAKGVYDMVGCTEAYFGNLLPEAPAFRFAERSYAELRKNGGLDYLSGLLEEKGVHWVGRYHDFGPFHLWLSKPIDKPDLTGLHLRVSPVYTAFFKTLGATTQTSNYAQVYTYMENGTVQGYGWPALGWNPGWLKVTKHRVDPGFYNSALHVLVNSKKWKDLGQAQKDVINKVVMQFEANSDPDNPGLKAKLKAQADKVAAGGLVPIVLTGADRDKWVSTARKAGWDEVLERSPEHGPKLMKLFTK
jgi:TRAP-type C4-dicarboxylate transport system substrate-binding protein